MEWGKEPADCLPVTAKILPSEQGYLYFLSLVTVYPKYILVELIVTENDADIITW